MKIRMPVFLMVLLTTVLFASGYLVATLSIDDWVRARFREIWNSTPALAAFALLAMSAAATAWTTRHSRQDKVVRGSRGISEKGKSLEEIAAGLRGYGSQYGKLTIHLTGSPTKISWNLAEALTLALRDFSMTGHAGWLKEIGAAVKDRAIDEAALGPISDRIRRARPFLDRPIPQDGSALLLVMREHAAAVDRCGRSVPMEAVVWMKDYDRKFWYGFLNAGRLRTGAFHPEGLTNLVAMLADGNYERSCDIAGSIMAEQTFSKEPS